MRAGRKTSNVHDSSRVQRSCRAHHDDYGDVFLSLRNNQLHPIANARWLRIDILPSGVDPRASAAATDRGAHGQNYTHQRDAVVLSARRHQRFAVTRFQPSGRHASATLRQPRNYLTGRVAVGVVDYPPLNISAAISSRTVSRSSPLAAIMPEVSAMIWSMSPISLRRL
jgi:hypothetical protein